MPKPRYSLSLRSAALGATLCAALAAVPAQAHNHDGVQDKAGHDHGSHAAAMASGEVRKVDKPGGKLTLRHGEIRNLNMEPMTMVFRVSQAAVLDSVKEGDKVNFSAERINGVLTVTRIEKAQ